MNVVCMKSGLTIVNTSPHSTVFDDGTVADGNPELSYALLLGEEDKIVGSTQGVELVKFNRVLTETAVDMLIELSLECDLILVPAIYSSVDRSLFPKECAGKIVAYLATAETQRSKPQDKIAQAYRFSLIY